MASTFSPILRIELIGTGDQSGTWGNTTNINLGTLIEQAIAGTATIDVTAANVTLTNFNGTTDEARCAALRVVGTPGVSRNIVAPAVSKLYVVANGSDSAVVLKTSVSTGLTVPVGEVYLAYFDTTSADFRLVGRASATTNTANTLVLRDASGNFAAGTITANLTGNVTGSLTGNVTGNVTGNTTGNHIGDVYASNGTSKVLESGTNGTDATFTGDVTGDLTGNVTGNVNTFLVGANSVGARTIQPIATGVPSNALGNNGDIIYQY